MDALSRLAVDLDDAAGAVDDAARALPDVVPAGPAYGADAPGRPGEVGRALHTRLTAAVDARAREAADAVARLADTARAVRDAANRYAEVDGTVDRRHRREL